MSSIRLLIADDHRLFRRGLRQVCELVGGFTVVGEAENGQEAVDLARQLHPDVILMDIDMPILNGVQATQHILQHNPHARIIVLTVYRKDEYVFDAVRAGARGYLLKDVEEEELIGAIQAVHRGEALIDPHVTAQVLNEFRRISQEETTVQPAPEPAELTDIEQTILRLLAQGKDNQAIGQAIGLAEKTVANRLSNIYQKIQVSSRTQAVLFALRNGLAPLEPET